MQDLIIAKQYISLFSDQEEENAENTPEILVGSKWTGIWITWGGGFISAGIEGTMKPLVMQEYKKKHGITSLYPETFLYYGVRGTNVLWSTAFCHIRTFSINQRQ